MIDALAVAERYRRANTELAEARKELADAVRQFHTAGWSYDRIAQALGVTKGRVQQIVKGE